MAYMSQERKQQIAPVVKAILKKYGVKGSLSVRHYSTLVLTIKSGKIDFIGNFKTTTDNPKDLQSLDVNVYWYRNHFSGRALNCIDELVKAMNSGNHDNSRAEVDYFDVGWYVDINIGKWNKPYIHQPE